MRSVTTSVRTDRPVICPRTSNRQPDAFANTASAMSDMALRHCSSGSSVWAMNNAPAPANGRPTDDVKRLVQRALDSLIERIERRQQVGAPHAAAVHA